MEIHDLLINAFITMFALGLLIVSIASYKKYKNVKLLFITAVFILFFIKAILFSYGLFDDDISTMISSSYFRLFDLGILIMLFLGTSSNQSRIYSICAQSGLPRGIKSFNGIL